MTESKVPGARCGECPLQPAQIAYTTGPRDAEVAVVSRSPGGYDVRAKKAFAGPSGQLLDAVIQHYGSSRDKVLATNLVLCESDKPPKKAIECCAPRLEREIANAKVLVCAGAEAVTALMGTKLSEARGLRHEGLAVHGRTRDKVIATFNPAAPLRDGNYYPGLVQDFRRAFSDPQPFSPPRVRYTEDFVEALRILGKLVREPMLAIDIETTGLNIGDTLVTIGFASANDQAYVLGHKVCRDPYGLGLLRGFFNSYQGKQLWHNGSFDCKILRSAHQIPARVDEDTLLLSYACDEVPGTHGLDYLLQNELEWPYYTKENVKALKESGFTKNDLGQPPTEDDWHDVYEYNGYDCVGSFQLYPLLSKRANDDSVSEPYRRLLIPGTEALIEVMQTGLHYDSERAREVRDKELIPKLEDLTARASMLVGQRINLNSSKQCGEFIYDVMKVPDPLLNRNSTKSVDEGHRDFIRQTVTNPIVLEFVDTLHQFKKLDKIRSTYIDGINKYLVNGLVYSNFGFNTVTGRLSSREPNLQNQPRTSDEDIARGEGYVNVRQLFYAPEGYVLIQADYSQVELRTAAYISQDSYLLDVYRNDRDLHSEMAAFLFGENFTKEQRVMAKVANFSTLFGIEAWYFSRLFQISQQTAQRILVDWWKPFPELREWVKDIHRQAMVDQEVVSPFGFKRRFPFITDSNVKEVRRQAVNSPVQGTASMFTVLAMRELIEPLREIDTLIAVPVHDSILARAPVEHTTTARNLIQTTMEAMARKHLGWDKIPFSVDDGIGQDWGHCK